MSMATYLSRLLAVSIVLGIVLATEPSGPVAGQAYDAPSTLTGERFFVTSGNVLSGDVTIIEASCNRAGTSTIQFTATGVATGPYPGTFTETGTATLGPHPGVGASTIYAEATSFEATFSIDSPAGQVTGRKFLASPPGATQGQCSDFSPLDPEVVFIPFGCAPGVFCPGVRYEAEIMTPGGAFRDRGSASVTVYGSDVQSEDPANSSRYEQFEENFFSDLLVLESVQGGDADDDDDDDGDADGDENDGDEDEDDD